MNIFVTNNEIIFSKKKRSQDVGWRALNINKVEMV